MLSVDVTAGHGGAGLAFGRGRLVGTVGLSQTDTAGRKARGRGDGAA